MKSEKISNRKLTNREKYGSFAEYILNDTFVLKFLVVLSKYFGAIIFSLLAWLLLSIGLSEIAFIIFILACFGWWNVIKFHKLGGWKNMPDFNAAQSFWGREYIKVKKGDKHGTITKHKTRR